MASFAFCYKLRAAATMCQILWKSRAVAAVVMCEVLAGTAVRQLYWT